MIDAPHDPDSGERPRHWLGGASGRRSALMFFPGALGDFLCFLPTAQAVQRALGTQLTLVTQPAFAPLLDPARFAVVAIDRRDVAQLFASTPPANGVFPVGDFDPVLSWTGSGNANFRRNLEEMSGGRARVFPFRGFRSGQLARDYFAQCLNLSARGHADIVVTEASRRWANRLVAATVRPRVLDRNLATDVDQASPRIAGGDLGGNCLVLHPGSGSRQKNWLGMADLAVEWRRRGGNLIVLFGPAEQSLEFPWCDVAVRDQPLDRIAAVLERIPLFVGNDSGIAHLAAAQSCHGCALFADSDPTTWQPGGGVAALHAVHPCDLCERGQFCLHRLPLDVVLRQLDSTAVTTA